MRDDRIKPLLIAQLNLKDHEKILDFGCGTGTLAVMMKKANSGCSIVGIDIDPQVLDIAKDKARGENLDVSFVEYDGIRLPFADESFDKVATSLVLHHLSTAEKYAAFKKIYRVLKRGGEFHILDIGVQRSAYTRAVARILRYIEPIDDNIQGKIPQFLIDAGFDDVKEIGSEHTPLFDVSYYSSRKRG